MKFARAILLTAVCVTAGKASNLTTTIGGDSVYHSGGWGEYAVVDRGTISFDLSARTAVTILSQVELTDLSCVVGPLGDSCIANRQETIRIDGELGFNSTHYYFDHVDQYRVGPSGDFGYQEFTTRMCGGIQVHEGPCQVTLSQGHHLLELYVSTSLGNSFDTHPNAFRETVSASVMIPDGAASVPEAPTAALTAAGILAAGLLESCKCSRKNTGSRKTLET